MGLVVRILQSPEKKEGFVDPGFCFPVMPHAEAHGSAVDQSQRSRASSFSSDGGAFLVSLKRFLIPFLSSQKVSQVIEDPCAEVRIAKGSRHPEAFLKIGIGSLIFPQTDKDISQKAQGFSGLSFVFALLGKEESLFYGL